MIPAQRANVFRYALGAEGQTEAVLKSLRVVWWVLVAEITATNLNNVYGSLVWAAQVSSL